MMRVRAFGPLLSAALMAGCSVGDGLDPRISGLFGRKTTTLDAGYVRLQQRGAPRLMATVATSGASDVFFRSHALNGVDYYLGRDGTTLGLRDGVLVSTGGVGQDLTGAEVSGSLALIRATRDGASQRVHSYLDGENRVVTITLACTLRRAGSHVMTSADGGGVPVTDLIEACAGDGMSFENSYAVRSGTILQSRQYVSAYAGTLVLQPG